MSEEKILIATIGVEGGGFDLYLLPNGKIEESGSSGGMMGDEEDDPLSEWTKTSDSLEVWWTHFTETNWDFWYYFHVVYLHPDYRQKISALALESLRLLETRPESFFDKEELERTWRLKY
ncbi:MAG: hypothetical protein LW630_09410 [Saprospiraceae bacterium]|nr:hypothetical protein [Saprospiraceae bacterium]